MRLYHLFFISLLVLVGCTAPKVTQATIRVLLKVDGSEIDLQLAPGSTVDQAINSAKIDLDALDRVDPPGYTLLTDGASLRVIRVTEEFRIEQEVIPFEKRVLQTDSLPDQNRMLAQTGENGIQEITYRVLKEDGTEVSIKPIKSTVIKDPIAEIIMVGVQAAFAPIQIPGKLAYISGNNAWLMEQSTSNRKPLITSGDLDGHIFTLSDDGDWLLFTRVSKDKQVINELWVADLSADPVKEINLNVPNVVHFADWLPGSNSKVAFSTVEPRETAPGWQANNDLYALSFSKSGWTSNWRDKPVLEANSGGVYGWWGTSFAWGPLADQLAYSRPDGVGIINFTDGLPIMVQPLTPLQTGSDWAWVPGFAWSVDGRWLYTVEHAAPEVSQVFNLIAVPAAGESVIHLVSNTGMFAYPIMSPEINDEQDYKHSMIAYLQAGFPDQSQTSSYKLFVMDADGSNKLSLFPSDNSPGLEPHQVTWSASIMPDTGNLSIAVVYQGNIWLVDCRGNDARQVTGDGLTSRISWK